MKRTGYTLLVLLMVLLAGCATTFRPWNLSEIREGMDRSAVVQLLGEPDYTEQAAGTEYLHYIYSESLNPAPAADTLVEFEALREVRNRQIERSLKESHFVVELKGGLVYRYRELPD